MRMGGACAAMVVLVAPAVALALDGWALRNDTTWYDTGNVVLVDVATGDATTVVSGGGCFGYCFSPDGTRIAFWRAGKIFTVALDGTDLVEVCDTYATGFREQYLSWTVSNHIYWSERSPYIYRVDVDTGVREVVHTSANGDIRLAKVSLDGRHAGCTRNETGWRAWAIDLESHEERDIGDGCQATASPDGNFLTHNIPGHQTANIHRFADLSVYTVLHKPAARGEFDMHEYSHSSNRYIVYTSDVDYAYVHDIDTDTPVFVGRGAPFDFRPTTLEPVLGLERAALSFTAQAGGAAPAAQTVAVLNLGGGALDVVDVATGAAWLTVTPSGVGNAQVLDTAVAIVGLAPGDYAADVTVSCANAVGSPASYAVDLEVTAVGANVAPHVDAGPDLSVDLGIPAWLDGSVDDDGLPGGAVQVAWSEQTGPGLAVFAAQTAAGTEVGFDAPGTYVLRLTADDGELVAWDETVITVEEGGAPSIVISSPAGGEVWPVGSVQEIRWSAVNLTDVAIRYSTDGGATVAGLITDSIDLDHPDWGVLPWTVPETPSRDCVIMVAGYFYEAPTQSGVFEIAPPGDSPAAVTGGCACRAEDGGSWGGLIAWMVVWRRRLRQRNSAKNPVVSAGM